MSMSQIAPVQEETMYCPLSHSLGTHEQMTTYNYLPLYSAIVSALIIVVSHPIELNLKLKKMKNQLNLL